MVNKNNRASGRRQLDVLYSTLLVLMERQSPANLDIMGYIFLDRIG